MTQEDKKEFLEKFSFIPEQLVVDPVTGELVRPRPKILWKLGIEAYDVLDYIEAYTAKKVEEAKRDIIKTIESDMGLQDYTYLNTDMQIGKRQAIDWIIGIVKHF